MITSFIIRLGKRRGEVPQCKDWGHGCHMLLLGDTSDLITAYNGSPQGRAYNQIAGEVYEARRMLGDPLSPRFEAYILKGLIGFDMGRTMKDGSATFATRLHTCLDALRKKAGVDRLGYCSLSSAELAVVGPVIAFAYNSLAIAGTLHPEKHSHVNATKTLHWLFPNLLLMVERS